MLLDLIEKHQRLVESYEILVYDHDGPNIRLKACVVLRDGSMLHIKQIVLEESNFKYAYHWQDHSGNLICRWDNAPHWPEIASYPHHKHTMRDGMEIVIESLGGDLTEVFTEIAEQLGN
ncbi:toxin-antitoxin system TumE family protein [Candidatus Venteria ishoeyi]|uniref:Uncharacterized protein n=1 Tax=Candidatus Venteria ishoeyi TaxID=1899563 RepID=A0A1H6F9X2_9GAMM|nr:DUF6516 family protein [Candidatus Venteria ishoeyi]SEH05824.1 Uncharacterised protein [Candidatus Venteria ishoeyi]